MNYEEKILEALAKQGEAIAKQREMLEKQGEMISQINGRLDRMDERLEELDDRSLRSAVALEGTVIPKLQLLYEGQENLRQTLAPRERVEVLEDEVITLKTVVKSMSRRLAALEKAQ